VADTLILVIYHLGIQGLATWGDAVPLLD